MDDTDGDDEELPAQRVVEEATRLSLLHRRHRGDHAVDLGTGRRTRDRRNAA